MQTQVQHANVLTVLLDAVRQDTFYIDYWIVQKLTQRMFNGGLQKRETTLL